MNKCSITIVAVNGCMGSAVHGLLDVFACANACAQERALPASRFTVRVVSTDGQPVAGYNGHPIGVGGALPAAAGSDVILLAPIMPATLGDQAIDAALELQRSLLPWLRRQAKAGICLATACTGSFLFAEAGLLDGKRASTHWRAAPVFRRRYPEVLLNEDEIVTDEGQFVCSGGAVSYLDLALHLVRRFGSTDLAMDCARMLVFDAGRDRQSPYRRFVPCRTHGDHKVLKAQDWIERHYSQDIDAAALAGRLGMSPRNFNRRFKAASGDSLTSYIQATRIAAACDSLAATNSPLQQIIFDVGYTDASSFSRLFKEATGSTMSEYRKRFQAQR